MKYILYLNTEDMTKDEAEKFGKETMLRLREYSIVGELDALTYIPIRTGNTRLETIE